MKIERNWSKVTSVTAQEIVRHLYAHRASLALPPHLDVLLSKAVHEATEFLPGEARHYEEFRDV